MGGLSKWGKDKNVAAVASVCGRPQNRPANSASLAFLVGFAAAPKIAAIKSRFLALRSSSSSDERSAGLKYSHQADFSSRRWNTHGGQKDPARYAAEMEAASDSRHGACL